MDLTGYVEALRNELAVAAATGGDDSVQLAERLTGPLDSAARLVLQEALSDAAQEITRDIAPGSIELRLRGRDLTFVVTLPPALDTGDQNPVSPAPAPESPVDGATSRISFRPPDYLKAMIEQAAEREGLSVNAFLVKTLAAAVARRRQSSSGKTSSGGERLRGWFR